MALNHLFEHTKERAKGRGGGSSKAHWKGLPEAQCAQHITAQACAEVTAVAVLLHCLCPCRTVRSELSPEYFLCFVFL